MMAVEALRIAAWRPRFGFDTDEKTIPHELDLMRTAVHLNKGCYKGQETIARVHNIGHPPRRIVFLQLDGSMHTLPAVGSEVRLGEKTIGKVTSAATHFEAGPIALAVIKRNIDPTVDLQVIDGEVAYAASQETIVATDAGQTAGRFTGSCVAAQEPTSGRSGLAWPAAALQPAVKPDAQQGADEFKPQRSGQRAGRVLAVLDAGLGDQPLAERIVHGQCRRILPQPVTAHFREGEHRGVRQQPAGSPIAGAGDRLIAGFGEEHKAAVAAGQRGACGIIARAAPLQCSEIPGGVGDVKCSPSRRFRRVHRRT